MAGGVLVRATLALLVVAGADASENGNYYQCSAAGLAGNPEYCIFGVHSPRMLYIVF